MRLTDKQLLILDASGHILVTGGPGSGKTTVSIMKAAQISERVLRPGQRVLFLSFARATVSRVVDAIENEQHIPRDHKRRIEIETYHSFFWRILKAHGYLVGLPKRLTILTPSGEAIALSGIRSEYPSLAKISDAQATAKREREQTERHRLAEKAGRLCFDLFAPYVGDLLQGSERIRELIATMYPVIVLDEFQDTNSEQWRVVQELGRRCSLVALADPEQRIYDWIGSDPGRLDHFRSAFAPTEIDLSDDNHRSVGTDIAAFGDDIASGKFRKDQYRGIDCHAYESGGQQAMTALVTRTYAARKRLVEGARPGWSLAILVPTKRMTRLVSDTFRSPPATMSPIQHVAAVEVEGAILAAEVIALLLQPDSSGRHFTEFIQLMKSYFQGRGGEAPTQGDLNEAQRLQRAFEEWRTRQASGRSIRANSILVPILGVYSEGRSLHLTGNPDDDWRSMRHILDKGSCSRLKEVAQEVRNVRLLDRGTQLRLALSQDWRDNKAYANALAITRQAFVQEHFATNARQETGVLVMNMHKAKGKQFDEVIIFDGWPRIAKGKIVANLDRIVRGNLSEEIDDQCRYNMRVSVTRGKQRTTILTPKSDPCVLLRPKRS